MTAAGCIYEPTRVKHPGEVLSVNLVNKLVPPEPYHFECLSKHFEIYGTMLNEKIQKQWLFEGYHDRLLDTFRNMALKDIVKICYNAGRYRGHTDMREGLKLLLNVAD